MGLHKSRWGLIGEACSMREMRNDYKIITRKPLEVDGRDRLKWLLIKLAERVWSGLI